MMKCLSNGQFDSFIYSRYDIITSNLLSHQLYTSHSRAQTHQNANIKSFVQMKVPSLLSTIHQCILTFSIDQITFNQICKFFNLIADSTYDPNPFNTIQEKFKNKLFDIFQTQGASYKDYLNLPKFATLKLSTQQKLRNLFNNIWSQYQSKLQAQKNVNFIQQFQKIIPQFKSLDEIQAFHLELLQSYKNSRMNKSNSDTQNSQMQFPPSLNILPELRYKRPHDSSYFMPETHSKYNQNSFSAISSSQLNKALFPKIQDDPKYSNQIWVGEKYVQNSPSFPIQNNKMVLLHQNGQLSNLESNKMSYNQKMVSHEQIQRRNSGQHLMESSVQVQEQTKKHLALNEEEFEQKINSLLFIECLCEGSLQQPSAPYIICKKCQLYFHFQCLLIDGDAIIDMCPCCKLKEGSNIFVNIHQVVFGKRWCKNMKSQKLSLFLTERQIEKLKIQKQACEEPSEITYQLRFLKIIKKTKINKKNSNQNNDGGNRRFNNIQLPKNFIQKLQPFNHLEIGLKPTDQEKDDECVYFFGIFLVQKYSQRQLTDKLFSNISDNNSVNESYMNQFMTVQQDYVEIKTRDPTSQRCIQYPVRGNNCSHAQVFDYLSFLEYYKEYGERLDKKHCPICEMQIDKVIADRFLLEKIRGLDHQDETEYEFIRYFKDGRVAFVEEQDSMGYSENDQDNEQRENDSEVKSSSD